MQHNDRPWLSLGGLLLAVLVSLAPTQPAAAAGKPIAFSASQLDAFDALKTSAKLPNGETLAYIDTGPRDGPPLVLVHGYTDTARDWLMIVRWGAKDAIIDDAQKDALRTALPKAQVKIYPEFGHNPIWEDPSDVANTIKGFLAN